ncbi:uncharacterized protein [Lolium perenne]|uniref:uncharacterized protein isoform X2 n=1 Tax=Lolium perenne TaxID=4522 RepID=UPI003A99576C
MHNLLHITKRWVPPYFHVFRKLGYGILHQVYLSNRTRMRMTEVEEPKGFTRLQAPQDMGCGCQMIEETSQHHDTAESDTDCEVPSSRVLQETCSYIRSLHREVDDLSERLSELLATSDMSTAQAAVIRSLLM